MELLSLLTHLQLLLPLLLTLLLLVLEELEPEVLVVPVLEVLVQELGFMACPFMVQVEFLFTLQLLWVAIVYL